MHRRTLDGKTLRFGHEGKLYNNSFVMYDKGTHSQWIHVTGECAQGRYKGRKLEFIPSKVMAWGAWKKAYPKTKVLPGRGRGGFMGTYVGLINRAGLGYHVRIGIQSKLYFFRDLETRKLIQDRFEKTPLLLVFNPAGANASAWDRRVDGKALNFEVVDGGPAGRQLKDRGTGSLWNLVSGVCLEGKLKGKALKPLAGIAIRLDRWRNFYPTGKVYRVK